MLLFKFLSLDSLAKKLLKNNIHQYLIFTYVIII